MIYRLVFRFKKCKNNFSQVLNWDFSQVYGGGGSGQGGHDTPRLFLRV